MLLPLVGKMATKNTFGYEKVVLSPSAVLSSCSCYRRIFITWTTGTLCKGEDQKKMIREVNAFTHMVKGLLKYETPAPLEHMWWTENFRNTLDVVILVLST